jgi:hypothetical protein
MAQNECDTTYYRCFPQAMADGSLAIKAANIDTRPFRLRIFDSTGKQISVHDMDADFQYLVPAETNVVIASRNSVLEAFDNQNKPLWVKSDSWKLLGRSRRPGYFYACNKDTLYLMDTNGESHFSVPESGELKDVCSANFEGPGNVLFIPQYNDSTHVQILWTVRLPDFQSLHGSQ